MLSRLQQAEILRRLRTSPAVAVLGPRQVGKTTLARAVAAQHPGALVLDMERDADRAMLTEPGLFLRAHRERLVVIDEVQRVPDLFSALRPEIDAYRQPGRFLLFGSASGELLRQSGQSLAGRIAYAELTPFLVSEGAGSIERVQELWLRGGFPLSWLAPDEVASYEWRQDFIRTFLVSDMAALGVRLPAETLRRFWTMLAHLQGQLLNASQLGQSLGGASHTTAARYLDTLVDALVVRRLEPFLPNVGKRLLKSPKVYVRDSGLLHALLGIASVRDLQGHPVAGPSWEGFVVEQVAAALPADAQLGFYRTAAGAELDLVVRRGRQTFGVEIKFSASPRPTRGFWQSLRDLQADQAWVVAPVERRYPLAQGVEVVPVGEVASLWS
ncbi:MAG: ATP-binding protein [Rubrivivax sp.]